MISAVRTPQLINGSIWHRAFNVICNSNVDWAGGMYAFHLRLEAQSSCHMLLASNERDERAQAALHCHAARCAVRTIDSACAPIGCEVICCRLLLHID